MLPPGHIAGGFLTAEALLHFAHPQLSAIQQTHLLWWGVFFSFAPDLDMFVSFALARAWWYKPGVDSSMHRKFYTHIPILWLAAGLIIYFLSSDIYFKIFGLLVWVGSWTHFLLDSIEYGVMWLWPFNKEVWAVKDRGVIKRSVNANNFFGYWMSYLRYYVTRWTFFVEVLIILTTLIIYFR